jgi:hypothetical protein
MILISCGRSDSGSVANAVGESGNSNGKFNLVEAFFTDGSAACSSKAGVKILFADFQVDRFLKPADTKESQVAAYVACANQPNQDSSLTENTTAYLAEDTSTSEVTSDSKSQLQTKFNEQCASEMKSGSKNTYLALGKMISPESEPDSSNYCSDIFTAGYETASFDFSSSAEKISDLSPLKYFKNINALNISNTQVATAASLIGQNISQFQYSGSALEKTYFTWKAAK